MAQIHLANNSPKSPEELQRLLASLRNAPPFSSTSPEESVRVGIYVHKSRLKPGQTDYSLDSQEDQAVTYATRHGWKVCDTYGDLNTSGRYISRRELNRLKRDVRAGEVDIIVVYSVNRIFRNLKALLKFIAFLQQYGVHLVSVTEPIDTDTPWGMLILEVLGALAEMFAREASERTRMMKHHRAKKGLLNGLLPLGYCKGNCSSCTHPNGKGYCPNFGAKDIGDGKVPVPHPVDQYAVRLIYELYATGQWSMSDIAHHLNTHLFELPTGQTVQFRSQGNPGRTSPGPFRDDTIRHILQNPTYIGVVAEHERPPLKME